MIKQYFKNHIQEKMKKFACTKVWVNCEEICNYGQGTKCAKQLIFKDLPLSHFSKPLNDFSEPL